MELSALKELLDRKYEQYHQYGFVADDPISVPHRYALRQDIEITAFVTATISWAILQIHY